MGEKVKDIIFLTGATGFLGTQIARRLLKKDNISLIVLVRGKNFDDARRRLSRAWWEWPEIMEEAQNLKKIEPGHMIKNKFYLVVGDISKENLGLNNIEYNYLVDNITHIIHTAADLRLNSPMEDLRNINVKGTRNIVKLGLNAHKNHGIKRFSHLSTAYVAGKQKEFVSEDTLTDNYGFLSNYEKSKYEGELEVRKSGLPISIFRP
jgi:long-chain acyl-CoA synthetase